MDESRFNELVGRLRSEAAPSVPASIEGDVWRSIQRATASRPVGLPLAALALNTRAAFSLIAIAVIIGGGLSAGLTRVSRSPDPAVTALDFGTLTEPPPLDFTDE